MPTSPGGAATARALEAADPPQDALAIAKAIEHDWTIFACDDEHSRARRTRWLAFHLAEYAASHALAETRRFGEEIAEAAMHDGNLDLLREGASSNRRAVRAWLRIRLAKLEARR